MSEAELREKLRTIISEVSEIDEIPDETPFKELGIDSMMAIEIVAEVERTYKLSIPEAAVYDLVREKLAEAA
jgi:acyl carrier protein